MYVSTERIFIMNTQNTLALSDNKTLVSGIKVDSDNHVVLSIATISDAILNLEKTKDKADYGISVLVNTLSNIENDTFKALDINFTDRNGKTVVVDNWTKYCKFRFDYSQSHCSKLKRVADKFFTLTNADNFLTLKANDDDFINTDNESNLAIIANTSCVSVLKDAFGFPFNISQLQELLTYSAETISDAIERCLITSASKSTSGDDSIRAVMKRTYCTETEPIYENSENSTENSGNSTVAYNVENNDNSRFNTILSLIESVDDDSFKSSDVTEKFVKYINVLLVNNKK